MGNLAVIGVHLGDEAKGTVVRRLGKRYDIGARGQGGANAGHQNYINGQEETLHFLPALAFDPEKPLLIGNGVVIYPPALKKDFTTAGKYSDLTGRVYISDRAHVTLQHHLDADGDGGGVGSTKRGIAPTYKAKAGRTGVRVIDLVDAAKDPHYKAELARRMMRDFPNPQDPNGLFYSLGTYINCAIEELLGLPIQIVDASAQLNQWMSEGKSVIFEGAQATLLDVDHGTYPFVTSSSPSVGGFVTGFGIDPRKIHRIIGVAKTTNSRVGDGPFIVEDVEFGDAHREEWKEMGSTSRRPRRLGKGFDTVSARYAKRINGIDTLALTCLDRLSGLGDLDICTEYDIDGRRTRDWPSSLREQRIAKPVFRTMKGFQEDIGNVREFEDLPKEARDYVNALEDEMGIPVGLIGVGREEEQYILRDKSLMNVHDAGSWGTTEA